MKRHSTFLVIPGGEGEGGETAGSGLEDFTSRGTWDDCSGAEQELEYEYEYEVRIRYFLLLWVNNSEKIP